MPQVISDSSASQVTKVLRGDYDLKISRQNYFISNQEKVLEHYRNIFNILAKYSSVDRDLSGDF